MNLLEVIAVKRLGINPGPPRDFDLTCKAAISPKVSADGDLKEGLPKSKFAYVGDPKDKSTWKLKVQDAKHARLALGRINQTDDIPPAKKAGVLNKVRRVAKSKGVEVSKPTSGQKKWVGHKVAAGGPGSGRHASGVVHEGLHHALRQHGFKIEHGGTQRPDVAVYNHPSKAFAYAHNSGKWIVHNAKDSRHEGMGPTSLHAHLRKHYSALG